MLIFNLALLILVGICLWFSGEGERLKFVPQGVALFFVLNKDAFLSRIGNRPKVKRLSRPLFDDRRSKVSIQVRLLPRKNIPTTIDHFRSANGYIERILVLDTSSATADPYGLVLSLAQPVDVIIDIRAYPGKTLPRFVTVNFDCNGQLCSVDFFIRRPAK